MASGVLTGYISKYTVSIDTATSDLAAAQAMSVIGFLVGISAVVLIVLFVVMNKPVLRLVGLIASFVAAGFILIGVIVVGDFNNGFYDVGWAMIMAILGGLLYVGTGIVLVVDLVKK
ncbi:hypothetical protein LOTGIDRAFT_161393 [Lottia gigantea]|uniref:Uncharacterized protein n=1 Tax=Lottia gigantea TaxID=225164 RepID=V4ABJ1_LOTGI|nr:hypothetical protein LOTGIDRAFT_161393 [Lottia gigantea]ESO94187.1 hypothetical protein LOTGIDRAFT_161393 [Lottia gigantea]